MHNCFSNNIILDEFIIAVVSVVLVSICYYSSSTSSRTIIFLITVPVPVLEPKSFQLLFQFQFWNHNLFNYCSSSSSGTLMFQILVLVLFPLLSLCKISKYKQKLSNATTNYVYFLLFLGLPAILILY